jgi:hypothetical protein
MWDGSVPARQPTASSAEARRWITWRAHDLGWTPERFARFERETPSRDRREHVIERVGKKYQWIAYHELTGRLADLVAVNGGFNDGPQPYRGPWQVGTREMDPTILVTRTEERDTSSQPGTWWSPHASRWREDPPVARIAWMRDRDRDVPEPVEQLSVQDPEGRRWLVLEITAAQNQKIVNEGETVLLRMAWHKVRSLLVKRADAERLIAILKASEQDRDHPPEVELPWQGYLGEYAWHPAYEEVEGVWRMGEEQIEVFGTTADRHVERSGHDYSVEESVRLTLPAPRLMRGLELRLADDRSLAFCDAAGTVQFKDPSAEAAGPSAAVVDHDALSAFLQREELEVVWILSGQKSAHGGRPHRSGWGGHLDYWGIYRFGGDGITGGLEFGLGTPMEEQLAEFLAYR